MQFKINRNTRIFAIQYIFANQYSLINMDQVKSVFINSEHDAQYLNTILTTFNENKDLITSFLKAQDVHMDNATYSILCVALSEVIIGTGVNLVIKESMDLIDLFTTFGKNVFIRTIKSFKVKNSI